MSLATDPAFDLAFSLAFPVHRVWAEVSPISQEARAIQRRAVDLGVALSDARLVWLDTTIVRPLKSAGIIAVSDRLFFPGRMPTDLAARINFVSPGTGDLSPTGGPVFTADEGYVCDGSDDHLTMSLSVTTTFSTTKWQQDSACSWARASSLTAGVACPLWGQTAGSTTIGMSRSSGNALVSNTNGSAATFGAAGTSGVLLAVRRSSTHVRGYIDGTFVSEQAIASAAPASTRTIAAMRGSATFSVGRFEAGGFGAQLSDDQITALQAVTVAAWSAAPPA